MAFSELLRVASKTVARLWPACVVSRSVRIDRAGAATEQAEEANQAKQSPESVAAGAVGFSGVISLPIYTGRCTIRAYSCGRAVVTGGRGRAGYAAVLRRDRGRDDHRAGCGQHNDSDRRQDLRKLH